MFYKFKLSYYDEYRNDEFPDEGLVYGESYGDAANKVVEDYGKNNVVEMYLQEITIEDNKTITKDEIDSAFSAS
jgi:hypothetical protein